MGESESPRAAAFKAGLGLAVWAAVHSLLAASATKELARRRLGRRRADGLYRLGYNALAVGSLGWLLRWARRLPDRPLYTAKGPLRALMLGGQAACVAAALDCARRVGFGLFGGATQAWQLGSGRPIGPTPEAQHPLPRSGRELGWGGAYRVSRHPLNYLALLLFWLSPAMTLKWAVVGAVGALYMALGSRHEGARLSRAYGERYLRYREETPHFLGPPRKARGDG